MRAVVDQVGARMLLEVDEVDVDTDPALEARYGTDVPVLLINGTPAFKFRVDARALEARLAQEAR